MTMLSLHIGNSILLAKLSMFDFHKQQFIQIIYL